MFSTQEQNINQLVIYKKSLDIFKLSRRVAAYITDDKDLISMYKSGSLSDNYADNLVMNAYRLVPKIVETETQNTMSLKLKYAKSLQYFIERIYQDCLKLESIKIQGKDYVQLLRKELKKLRKIHVNYVNSLV
ncbi:MAG: hypothetical protein JKY16_01640 [Lutibacter sp.]|nr:hypothetical protein [Lutibacter sp.]